MRRPPRIPREVIGKSIVKAEAKKERTAEAHLVLTRLLPCCATGQPGPSDPHHLMRGVDRGMSFTAAGRFTVPVCRRIHDEITPHGKPEEILMARYGVDARALADALWATSGDLQAMIRVNFKAFQESQQRMSAVRRAS